jgi:hypothetical protein
LTKSAQKAVHTIGYLPEQHVVQILNLPDKSIVAVLDSVRKKLTDIEENFVYDHNSSLLHRGRKNLEIVRSL